MSSYGRIVVAAGVEFERCSADCGIFDARRVGIERCPSHSGVVESSSVVHHGPVTDGSVFSAERIRKKRIETNRGVATAWRAPGVATYDRVQGVGSFRRVSIAVITVLSPRV